MDFVMAYRLIECMREGLPPDYDVYDAATWSAPFPLTEMSVAKGSAPMKFPDFTRGNWNTPRALRLIPLSLRARSTGSSSSPIAISFFPALFFWRRASSSTTEFFTSGRSAPWWLVGISMVATTFSTDTPNLVTNLVRERGVSENWLWWSFLLTGMMTVFFYARLWRRRVCSPISSFMKFDIPVLLRALLRGFRAVYSGLFFNLRDHGHRQSRGGEDWQCGAGMADGGAR